MGRQMGDAMDYEAEDGRKVRLRIVGAVANSILQGNLLMDEARFRELFPSASGARMIFIDLPTGAVGAETNMVSELARGLADTGLDLVPAPRRLAEFNAVQNTYLGTFQMLGGLGFLLGSAGLALVVLRNIEERRGELALLSAAGFSRGRLQRMVMLEHILPFLGGLGLGLSSAAVAVAPALFSSTTVPLPGPLCLTILLVLVNGFLCAWGAVRFALRGELMDSLKRD
jgi:ABC-type antimicrobial peptide transport system permease subunit